MQLDRPEASRWARMSEETRPKYQARGGREGAREGTEDVSATSKSTYSKVSKARELKIPGGSSVRPLDSRFLTPTRSEIEKKK